ncbi:MAG: hypothetical protein WB607_00230, partial [Candidatus Acidiferrum sp.]
SHVCMITGIAERIAITMMVTASSFPIVTCLCPLRARAQFHRTCFRPAYRADVVTRPQTGF